MGERIKHCDECAHFAPWQEPAKPAPPEYNPCALGHAMAFKLPDGPLDLNWGFHAPTCTDRDVETASQAPCPAPYAPPRTPNWHEPQPTGGR